MQYSRKSRIKVPLVFGLTLALLLLATVACGGAAATPVVVEKEVPKDVVVAKEVGKEVVAKKLIVATAVPAEAAP